MLPLLGVAVLVIGAVAFWRRPPELRGDPPATARTEPAEHSATVAPVSVPAPAPPAVTPAPVAVSPVITTRAVKEPSNKAVARAPKTRLAALPKAAAPIKAATVPVDASSEADSAASPAASVAPDPATAGPAPVAALTAGVGATPVTITGCLEISVDEDEFRLTDTEGASAPKSRSWRTAFLKKRSAPVALVEPPNPKGLQMQIGKRVAATGLLTSHELKVSSLRVVGPSCN